MTYCLNPQCPKPQNPKGNRFCQNCGAKLLLKERYRALKVIGQGGFGKTFVAVDEDIPSKPLCVIKQFLPEGNNNLEKATELFAKEAIRLDTLGKHPQIPELLAHFEQDNRLYLVQEFIDGQNIALELAQEGPFKEPEIREFLLSLLPVLEFIHENNVIHRDLKPENIIKRNGDGQLFLVDFGAAKFATGTSLVNTGTIIGSPAYAAPEQTLGKAIFASDIYSLGITCVHLLTQVDPFDLFDVTENAWAWRDYLLTPVSQDLKQILDKMIERATKKRYQSASEVLQDVTLGFTKPSAKPKSKSSYRKVKPKLVEVNGRYGYINSQGEMTIGLQYDEARRFNQEGLAAVKIGKTWGYINTTGELVIPPQYNQALSFAEGLAAFRVYNWLKLKNIWGYINKKGEIVIQPQFNQAFNFSESLALVQVNSLWGYINNTGQVVIPPKYSDGFSFKNGLARVQIAPSQWGFINKTGEIVIPPKDDARNFSEGMAAVQINNQWGYVDKKGAIVLQPRFKSAGDFCEGLAPVLVELRLWGLLAIGYKWGFINVSGEMAIEPQFDWANQFSQGLAAIKKNDKWGYINKNGQILIPPQFDLAGDFEEGMAEVMLAGRSRYIDQTGKLIY